MTVKWLVMMTSLHFWWRHKGQIAWLPYFTTRRNGTFYIHDRSLKLYKISHNVLKKRICLSSVKILRCHTIYDDVIAPVFMYNLLSFVTVETDILFFLVQRFAIKQVVLTLEKWNFVPSIFRQLRKLWC